MRVRKLAKDLECSPEQLLALLGRLGQARYHDAEQQLPDPIIQLVRRHAGDLKKGKTWSPPPDTGPVRRLDGPRPAPTGADAEAIRDHYAGVKPLAAPKPAAKAVKAVAARPVPRAGSPVVVAPVVAAPAGPTPAAPTPAPPAGLDPAVLAGLRSQEEAARAMIAALAEERAELQRDRAELREDRASLRADRDALVRRAEEAEAELARLRARLEAQEQELARARTASPATPEVSLRRLLEARGLRGDDELGAALAGFAEAHRTRELFDVLGVLDVAAAEQLLSDRVVLLAPDEEVPTGLVPVRVAPDRSEGPGAAAVRGGLNRLATALLIRGRRKLAVIGGPGALHRVLREALDVRIELRLFPTPRGGALPDVPAGAVVALWGEAAEERRLWERHPDAARVPTGGLPRLCTALVEMVERD